MQYLGEAQSLRRIGDATLQILKESTRMRIEGKNWFVELPYPGDVWSTKIYRADFDANGQSDFWIQAAAPSYQGTCPGGVNLIWLRFDEKGLPTLETAHSYEPFPVTDQDEDGRAEFRISDCLGKTISQWEEDPTRAIYQPNSDWATLRARTVAKDIPEIVIWDAPEYRSIIVERTIAALKRAIREGHAATWMLVPRTRTRLLWIDGSRRIGSG